MGLFSVLLAAGLGLPLPEDIPLILSGYLVSQTDADLTLMMITGVCGVIFGDSALFMLGRRYGDGLADHRWFRSIAKPWLLEKARHKYEHHGAKILFAARFMPGLRCVLFLTAGFFKVPYWKFLVFDGSAALISVPAWIWAGWHFSGKIEKVFESARMASHVIIGVAIAALILWGFWEYYHNLRKKTHAGDNSTSAELERASAPLVANTETTESQKDSSPQVAAADSITVSKPKPTEFATPAE